MGNVCLMASPYKIFREKHVKVFGMGGAIYKACKLGLKVQEDFKNVELDVRTQTVECLREDSRDVFLDFFGWGSIVNLG